MSIHLLRTSLRTESASPRLSGRDGGSEVQSVISQYGGIERTEAVEQPQSMDPTPRNPPSVQTSPSGLPASSLAGPDSQGQFDSARTGPSEIPSAVPATEEYPEQVGFEAPIPLRPPAPVNMMPSREKPFVEDFK